MDEFTGTVYVSVALQKHPWWIPDPLLITTEALPNIRRPWSQLIGQPLGSSAAPRGKRSSTYAPSIAAKLL